MDIFYISLSLSLYPSLFVSLSLSLTGEEGVGVGNLASIKHARILRFFSLSPSLSLSLSQA